MPVTRLLVGGEVDAQLLAPLFAGNPVVEAIKSSKNALAPRTRTERQKTGVWPLFSASFTGTGAISGRRL